MSDYYIPWLYNVIKSFKKTFNSNVEQNSKLKDKDTETWKTKTQKEENLVLPEK